MNTYKDLNYGWEKFNIAVLTLKESNRSLKERMISVYYSTLNRDLDNHLPDSCLKEFKHIQQAFTRNGNIEKSINNMCDSELEYYKEYIIKIYNILCDYCD